MATPLHHLTPTYPAGHRRLIAANEAACSWFRAQLASAGQPRRYLTQRGLGTLIDREWPWRIGYAPPGWNNLTDHLLATGFTADELVTAGLSTRTRTGRLIDVFRDRIMFPIRDPAGHVVAFIGRASPQAAGTPKYLNTHSSPIYDKDRLLYGLAEQRDRLAAGWTPALVEGPVDTLATWLSYSRSGRSGVVALAPCGTAFSATQANILRALAQHGIIVAFDGDSAGRKAADAAYALLHEPPPPGPLLAAEFAAGSDPGDLLTRPNGRAQLRAALRLQTRPLAVAVVDHHLDRCVARWPRILQEIGGRHHVAHVLARQLFDARDATEVMQVAEHIARRTGVGLDVILRYAIEHLDGVVTEIRSEMDRSLSRANRPPPAAAFPRLHVSARLTPPRQLPNPQPPPVHGCGDDVYQLVGGHGSRLLDSTPGVEIAKLASSPVAAWRRAKR